MTFVLGASACGLACSMLGAAGTTVLRPTIWILMRTFH
ncbi:putative membrane protein [Lysobacter antibioticus]|nr:putative membrane protein [Lysobacter antibioticus]